jgi:multidrug efflux pump subunit AcrB
MVSKMLTNPRMVALLGALILVAGLAAVASLPRLEDPYIVNRHAILVTPFPGASAERIESLVAEPLEAVIREIPEVRHITSHSSGGVSVIVVQLEDAVKQDSSDRLWAELRDKIQLATQKLPAGAGEPYLDTDRNYAFTWIGALSWGGSGPADLLRLGRYSEELASRLRNLSGTDIVKVVGAPTEEIQVQVDVVKAAAVGLDVPKIAELLGNSDAKTAAGELSNDTRRLSLELIGGFDAVERIRRTPLLTLPDGGSLQLQDLASVYRGEPSTPRDIAVISGERAVAIGSRMLPHMRGDHWTATLQSELADFEQTLPDEIQLNELFVQERYNEVRLGDLVDNILLGFAFIFIILLFTLGWRSAVIVAASLPLTMLFSFACMRMTDMPIHQMSVTGLIVALGIMVDNAIVVADTVMRNRRNGLSAAAAATKALHHLWIPLLGSTLTTMLTFMPVMLMPGPAGEFIGPLARAVIFSLAGSWVISLFIIAPVAGKWLATTQANGMSAPRLNSWFRRQLAWVLLRPRRMMLAACVLPVVGFISSQTLPEQFFPPSDRDMINLELYLPEGSSIEQTRAATEQLTAVINSHPEVVSLHWFIGRNALSFYYNLADNKDGASNYAQTMMKLVDFKQANRLVTVLQSELDEKFPDYQIIVQRLAQGPPSNAPVEFRLYGNSLSRLKIMGDELRRIAQEMEGVVHVRDSLGQVVPKIWLDVDESEAQRSQVGLKDIASLLAVSVDGVVTSSMLDGTQQLPVRVSGADIKETSVDALMSFPLVLPSGPRPLSALASVELLPAQAKISRRDGRRVNMVEVFIRDDVLPAEVLARIQSHLVDEGFEIPVGYRLEIGGESESRNEAVGNLMGKVGIILVLLIVTVVMAFDSFRLSAVVFAVAIQSAGMGMLSLWLSQYPFGFTSIIGLMGLMGLAVNAAIVILTELKAAPLAMAGDKAEIVNIVSICTKHISSTTITTVAGLLPLIIAGGGFWPPFAVVLAGGTVLTTILSLFFVPAAFLVLRKPYVFKYLPTKSVTNT